MRKHVLIIFSFSMLMLMLMLILGISPLQAQETVGLPSFKGRVLSVSSAGPQPNQETEWETQLVTVRLLSGNHKNETITLLNTLTGHPYFDLKVKKDDRVIIQADSSGPIVEYFIADFSRKTPLIIITMLFIFTVLIIGGRQGIKALISLLGMGLVIATIIFPLLLKGYNPMVVTVGICSLLTGLFIIFVSGYSKKTIAAICGTVGGLLFSGILAFAVGKASYLTGLSSGEAQILQFMDSTINFQGLLFSGMIIGALGAILDVGISIASSMEQIKEADPETDFKTLFTRGLLIGRDLIATMSNTLILAYVGSSLPLLLLFQANQNNWSEIINLDLMASEIVRAMTGSIGLTLAIPITAFVSAFLFVQPEHKGENVRH